MSIPTRSHVEIAQDELDGLNQLGYAVEGFAYSAREGVHSATGRLWVVLHHALLLVRKAWRFRPDVIYFNSRLEKIASTRDFITIVLMRVLYFRRVLFMVKSHGSDLEVLDDRAFWMRKMVLPFLKRNLSAWLFLSSEEKAKVHSNGYLKPHTLFVVKNIVRTQQFQKDSEFRSRYGINEDRIILLFTGRFIREKGVFEVVESYIESAKRHKVCLFMVGDGPEKGPLENRVNEAGLQDQVFFTGFIPEREVVPYYSNADLLVFPTYFPEGFPMALFNAVGAGLSIVTTPTRAAVDYLDAPANCLWVKAKNSASVASAIQTLLKIPAQRQAMGLQNRQKALAFSREKVSTELSEIIESILIKRFNH